MNVSDSISNRKYLIPLILLQHCKMSSTQITVLIRLVNLPRNQTFLFENTFSDTVFLSDDCKCFTVTFYTHTDKSTIVYFIKTIIRKLEDRRDDNSVEVNPLNSTFSLILF